MRNAARNWVAPGLKRSVLLSLRPLRLLGIPRGSFQQGALVDGIEIDPVTYPSASPFDLVELQL